MKKTMCILLLSGLVLLAGCGQGSPDPRVGTSEGVGTATPGDNPVINIVRHPISDLFGDAIDILDVNKRTNNAGFLDVSVKAHNRSHKIIQFQYRFRWVDKDEFPIDSQGSTWKLLSAQPGTDFNFFGTAPVKEAVDFKLDVRKNR